jgi:hypothetical protein
VTVLRRNGQPAVRAQVVCERGGIRKTLRADTEGRVRFADLGPGEHRLTVRSAGLLPMAGTATVGETGDVEVELREGEGGTLEVAVVDEEHRPLPFAALAVKTPSGLPWVDMVADDVQRLDPYTGATGARRLTHLEPGTVEVTATWGSRKETAKVLVEEGQTTGVLIVLPRPSPGR